MAEVQTDIVRSIKLTTDPQSQRHPPQWWAQAVVIVGALPNSALSNLRLEGRRAGTYEFVDFLLVLTAYAVSFERSLSDFFFSAGSVAKAVMGLWGRTRLPVESTVLRGLEHLTDAMLESVRSLFFRTCSRTACSSLEV